MTKWYLVCYLGMGNAISVASRHGTLEEAEGAMKSRSNAIVCFILESWA